MSIGDTMERFLLFLSLISVVESCEPIREPLCQTGITYNLTIFPNLAGHLFQGGASVGLQNIRALIDRKCSPNIREFLCRIYMPECYQNAPVLPSWEMCQEAYEGCNTLLSNIGYSWSFSLNCAKFVKSTIDSIKKKAQDKNEFWFGTKVNTICNSPHATVACKNNIHPGRADSIVSRFNGNLDVSQVDRLLQINYTYTPETFKSCHNTYSMTGGSFQVDPLSPASHHPFQVRSMPTVSWSSDSSKYYTLVLYDIGIMDETLAVYMNIPGHDLSRATSIVAYESPMNPTEVDSPYVFLLYEQTARITPSQMMATNLKNKPVETLHSDRRFLGPKAISWVRIQQDPYSIKTLDKLGIVNNCPLLVSTALHKHQESFIPNNLILDMSLDVRYSPSGIHFRSCCETYVYQESSIELNPIGNMEVKTAHVRSSAIPTVNLKKRDWYPNATNFDNSERYALVMVDPDASSSPYIHWMVLNIRRGDVNEGVTVREYKGPQPPNGVHTYFFLLYKQTAALNAAMVTNYTSSCSRCNFKINNFVTDNHMELVGATWMRAAHDEYVRHLHVDENNKDRASVCAHQAGYPSSCSTNSGAEITVGR